LRPFIAWVGSHIRAAGKAVQMAEATQASTVLSGMLRSGTRDSILTAAGTIAGDGPDPAFIEVPARERQQRLA
jgi:hypothetical protein